MKLLKLFAAVAVAGGMMVTPAIGQDKKVRAQMGWAFPSTTGLLGPTQVRLVELLRAMSGGSIDGSAASASAEDSGYDAASASANNAGFCFGAAPPSDTSTIVETSVSGSSWAIRATTSALSRASSRGAV